jgi:HSP20 family protein
LKFLREEKQNQTKYCLYSKEVFTMFRQPMSWREFERLRQDFDRLFNEDSPRVYRQRTRTFPAVNIWTNENEGAILMAEIPGVAADDINISVTADSLTINGTRKPIDGVNLEQYHRREQRYGEFTRVVQLPYTVNSNGVEASVSNGILRIFLPRAEAEKPRQITVKAGS